MRGAFLLLGCTSIGCYDVVPIETSDLEGEGGAGSTVFTSAASGMGKGTGKAGASSVSSASTQTVATSAPASSSTTGFDFALYRSCQAELEYKGACAGDGAMAIYWRGNDATRVLCQPDDPITEAPFCALNLCPVACEERECVVGGISNAACFGQQAAVVPCRSAAYEDKCVDGVAIAKDPDNDDNCYIRDCKALNLTCVPGAPPRCM